MIKSISRWIFAVFIIFPQIVLAHVCAGNESASADTTLLFVNGILNNSAQAQQSAAALALSLSSNGFDVSKINIQCYFNGTEGAYDDTIELRIQAAISSKARTNDATNTDSGYYARLGAAYRGLIDKNTNCAEFLKYTDAFLGDAAKYGTAYYEEKHGGDACVRVISGVKALSNSLRKYSNAGPVLVVAHSQGNFYLEAAHALLMNEGYTHIDRIQAVGVAAISQKPVNGRYLVPDRKVHVLKHVAALPSS